MEIKIKIREFLEAETQQKIADVEADLIAGGILDSFTMIKLIDFLEKETGKKADMEKLSPENFNSVSKMAESIKEWK